MDTSATHPLVITRITSVHDGSSRASNFFRHFMEMCAAMCIGEAALDAVMLATAAALFGYADPLRQIPQQAPELTVLVIAFNMSVPMAAWMRFRGMQWRPISEMSAAMFVLAVGLIGVASLGVIEKSTLVFWLEGLMMPAMLVPMFVRLDVYTAHPAYGSTRSDVGELAA